MNWIAIGVTLKLAMLTALLLVVIGLPIAYWVSFSRWRWKFLVESVVALPLVLPPTVLGFYVLMAIGSPRPHPPPPPGGTGASPPFSFGRLGGGGGARPRP